MVQIETTSGPSVISRVEDKNHVERFLNAIIRRLNAMWIGRVKMSHINNDGHENAIEYSIPISEVRLMENGLYSEDSSNG